MSLAVSTLSKKDYVARHERPLEAAITLAIKQAVNERVPDPIVRVGEILSGQGPTADPSTDPTTNSTAEWTLAAFAASLGVAGGVAAALVSDSTTNQFELARSFESEEAIAERLSAGSLIEKVARVLWAGVAKLKAAEAATAEQEVEVAKDDPSASATVNAAKAAAPTEAPPTAADKLLAASFPPGTPVDTQKAILAEVVRMRRLDPDEYARLGSKYVDAGELWAALEALDGTATLLLRASWVKTQRGGRLPKRGSPLPPGAFITVQELREIHAKSSAKHALPVIALSQCVPPC